MRWASQPAARQPAAAISASALWNRVKSTPGCKGEAASISAEYSATHRHPAVAKSSPVKTVSAVTARLAGKAAGKTAEKAAGTAAGMADGTAATAVAVSPASTAASAASASCAARQPGASRVSQPREPAARQRARQPRQQAECAQNPAQPLQLHACIQQQGAGQAHGQPQPGHAQRHAPQALPHGGPAQRVQQAGPVGGWPAVCFAHFAYFVTLR